ncbi:uncharacterized protein LOC100826793 [Brachypodium distachyon]|uniref:Uncharacterized protein n=1 Tax=Brachypodium distachyon TaxID=15368 RepID=I1IIK9_BRADI|nr:uncharacterized protein LOC100826793 [Brachypodium distachyon]KQJ86815.1 hypothetical protein BRADI_4g07896v3 [Brachypodium distachyon]|eukprot:XP_003576530.1 uncharacterized protein LOC100826793 [Brachypodium distachyon]
MLLIRRGKGSRSAKKVSSAPFQSPGALDGGAAGSNSRQVAPDDVLPVGTTSIGYASSRDEAFFEASPWLDSDCEDDFFSVNGDATPARTFSSASNNQLATAFGPQTQKLPTLEAILKAEPLKPRPLQMKLGDLLKEEQEAGIDGADELSRAWSSRAGDEAGRCCFPQLARVIHERRKK